MIGHGPRNRCSGFHTPSTEYQYVVRGIRNRKNRDSEHMLYNGRSRTDARGSHPFRESVVKDIRTSTNREFKQKTGYLLFRKLLVGKTGILIFLFENCDFGVYSLTETRRWQKFLNLGQMRQDAIISYSVYVPVPVFTCNASLTLEILVNGE